MSRTHSKWWCNTKIKVFYILCLMATLVYEIEDFDWNLNTDVMFDFVNRFSNLTSLQREIIVDLTNMVYQIIVPTLVIAILMSIVLNIIYRLIK